MIPVEELIRLEMRAIRAVCAFSTANPAQMGYSTLRNALDVGDDVFDEMLAHSMWAHRLDLVTSRTIVEYDHLFRFKMRPDLPV